ncbi:DUF7507 domain-containing protein, partial [Kitasatospora sp. NPDC004531]
YLGVGLDVLGNYFGDWEHRGNGCPTRSPAGTAFRIPAPGPNMVTLRGPGDGLEGYCFLTATTSNFSTAGPWPSTLPGSLQGPLTFLPPGVTPAQAQTLLEPSRRRVNVHLTPAPAPVLTVTVDFNDGTGPHQVLQTAAPQPVPATYKFGFAGSTGLFTDVHLIRNVVIHTDQPLPELNLVKQAHQPLPADLTVGSPIPYDFVVTNSGNVPIDNLGVTDPKVGPVSCPVTVLQPGETVTCTAAYLIIAADAAAGYVRNTARATGTADGAPVQSPPSSEELPVVAPPGLEVTKTVDFPGPFQVGDLVRYTYLVTNTGGTQLTGLTLDDDKTTDLFCLTTTLAPRGSPGDSTQCHGSYVITAADADAGQVTNRATATATAAGQPVTSPETQATVPVVGPSSLDLAKATTTPGSVHAGDALTYTYTATNTGTTTLKDLVVTDDHITDVTCNATDLAPGQQASCTGGYVVTDADVALGHLVNRAQAAATNPEGGLVLSPYAEVLLPVEGIAELRLEKTADSPGPFRAGDTVTYTYTVTDTGTGTAEVHELIVHDNHIPSVECAATVLRPGESTTCHGSYQVHEGDALVGHVTNSAHAEGRDPSGRLVESPSVEATVPVLGEGALLLEKWSDRPGPFHLGEPVTYTYQVRNTGTAAVDGLTVQDDHIPSVDCETTTLEPGQVTRCSGTYYVTVEDVVAGQVVNTAVAHGTDTQGRPVESPPVSVRVPVEGNAELHFAKSVDSPGPFRVGDTVPYTYTVGNSGTVPVHSLTVVDDHVPSVACEREQLNPGELTLCHGSYVATEADAVAGRVTNTAHAEALDHLGRPVVSPPDEATVPVLGEGRLTIEKAADAAGPFHAGDTVAYTYTVINSGTATVDGLIVLDDHVPSVTCALTTLLPGRATLCQGTYTVTGGDAREGQVTNTAFAHGTDYPGHPVDSPPVSVTVPVLGTAELSLAKGADRPGPFRLGDPVTYTYTVADTGTAAVHDLTVADDRIASVTCDDTTLNPGQATQCHGTYVITAADVRAGTVTNTAYAEGADPQGLTVRSPSAEATVPVVGEGALVLGKAADAAGPFRAGDTVPYTYTVTDTGTAAVHDLTVTDDRVTSVTCDSTTLNPGGSTLCHGSYVVTAADVQAGSVTNTAHASGTDPQGQTVQSPPAQVTVDILGNPELTLEKTPTGAGPFHVGDTVAYTYTATNAGTAALHDLTVTDDHVATVTCDLTTLNPGGSTLCHGTYVVTAADLAAGQVTNTARASGTDPSGRPVQSPPVEATVTVTGVAALGLAKAADAAGPFHAGESVSYTYTVTNTGTAAVHDLVVADDHVTAVTCDATALNPGGSTLCHGTYVVSAADAVAGQVTNTAHASGMDPEGAAVHSPPARATVPVAGEGRLLLEKAADAAGPFHVGESVSYTYTVINTGTAAVHDLAVADDHVTAVTCDATTLDPGRSTLCHGTYLVTEADASAGHVTNTARASGADPSGRPVQSPPAEATVPVAGASAIGLVKSADAVGPFRVGDTVSYTYTVTNSGSTVLTGVAVSDDRVASVECEATTLAPGASTACRGTYVVTGQDVEAGHVTNTAHASGADPEGRAVVSAPSTVTVETAAGASAIGLVKSVDAVGPFQVGDTVDYTYTVTNSGSTVLTGVGVSDDRVASVECEATTLAPGASTTCRGSYLVTAQDARAGQVTNTASASARDPQGEAVHSGQAQVRVTVQACSPKGRHGEGCAKAPGRGGPSARPHGGAGLPDTGAPGALAWAGLAGGDC